MSGLYSRYHGRLLRLARQAAIDGVWRAKLAEILAEFDADCSVLSQPSTRALRQELATQIEHEVLRFSDYDKRAALTLALKHFDAGEG
jgi:hypothetical protein